MANGSFKRHLQRYLASGLNLVTVAITLWNTVYLERATAALKGNKYPFSHQPALTNLVSSYLCLSG